jgi:hypothetical protein
MALEPLYYLVIVALILLLVLQHLRVLRWRRAAGQWRGAAESWRRLAGDSAHHRIGLDHINRQSIPERTEDQ